MSDFFEEPSQLDKRCTRGDNVRSVIDMLNEELYKIEQATRPAPESRHTLDHARKALVEARRLLDEIDDEICERDEHGSRKDGGK